MPLNINETTVHVMTTRIPMEAQSDELTYEHRGWCRQCPGCTASGYIRGRSAGHGGRPPQPPHCGYHLLEWRQVCSTTRHPFYYKEKQLMVHVHCIKNITSLFVQSTFNWIFFSNVDNFHNPYNDKIIIIILKFFLFINPMLTHLGKKEGTYTHVPPIHLFNWPEVWPAELLRSNPQLCHTLHSN